MNIEYYTWEELERLGCPTGLVMQYIMFTKQEIDSLICVTQSVAPLY